MLALWEYFWQTVWTILPAPSREWIRGTRWGPVAGSTAWGAIRGTRWTAVS